MKRAEKKDNPKAKKPSLRTPALICLFSLVFFLVLTFTTASFFLFPTGKASAVVEIPDYTGRRLSEIVPEAPIALRVEYRYDGEYESGVVLSQTPTAGSFCKLTDPESTVDLTLTVSMGRESALLPQTVGKNAREAEQELRALGFVVKLLQKESAYPAGSVFASEPVAGERLPLGEIITLYVSAGAPARSVTVPDLVGLSREDALVRVWMSSLSVAEVRETDADGEREGLVIDQSHRPGTVVPAGTGIVLYVGRRSDADAKE